MGRPKGSKNKPKVPPVQPAPAATPEVLPPGTPLPPGTEPVVKRRGGRPKGSKNKPKVPAQLPPVATMVASPAQLPPAAVTPAAPCRTTIILQAMINLIEVAENQPDKPVGQVKLVAELAGDIEVVPKCSSAIVPAKPTPPASDHDRIPRSTVQRLSAELLEAVAKKFVGKPVVDPTKKVRGRIVGEVIEAWVDGDSVKAKIHLKKEDRTYTSVVFRSVVS